MEKKKISLFYKVLLGFLLALLLVFVYVRFGLLRPWLTRFEAAQPKHASQEVFQTLFQPADWGQVYDLAGLEDSVYRGREDFIRSMEELTAGRELTLVETSAGLSGGRRYIVKLDSDSVAAFTLANEGGEGQPDWKLDRVELLAGQTGFVSVRALAGQRVLVNGQELGEECQVQTTETLAERYLPQGVQGRRTVLWQTQTSTLRQAEVRILDQEGRELPLSYDGESGCFMVKEEMGEPGEEERALLLNAAKTYALFMIRESTAAQLQRYFDSESDIYKTIRGSEIWMQNSSGYSFEDETVTGFFQYAEDLFSARVSLELEVRRKNGSVKSYPVDSTIFFRRTGSGWRAFEMTNVDAQEEIVHTRLDFMQDQEELGRLFVSSQDHSFTPPAVSPPEGQQFAGWAIRERQGDSVTMTVRFQPGEDGTVALPEGYVLEPMTLYAAFEAASE